MCSQWWAPAINPTLGARPSRASDRRRGSAGGGGTATSWQGATRTCLTVMALEPTLVPKAFATSLAPIAHAVSAAVPSETAYRPHNVLGGPRQGPPPSQHTRSGEFRDCF